jgi:maltooligosyltrehalose trehalohydrolase
VWAPAAKRVDVVLCGEERVALESEPDGYFSGLARARAGDRYQFALDQGDMLYPDPASRFQPEGPHTASVVVDPASFAWTDERWNGRPLEGQVIYEIHVGTFTREGTWSAMMRELDELAAAGITVLEVMPIAEFDGQFGWGYDGVDLFAPFHGYGSPDELRACVDRAHALGLAVILDVVYNHFGPSGNYLRAFSPAYFSTRYGNEWGDAINFDDEHAGPVREFFIANARYWVDEFHFDGLRLDATQQIFDTSSEHILQAVGSAVRDAARGRHTILVSENETQQIRLVRSIADGGYGLDALWNDDFHHSAMVALTGRAEAYYSETHGDPQEFISAAKHGFLFQGQFYAWQRAPRGTASLDTSPARFVNFLQNHDQVANSVRGARGHQLTSPTRWRAMTALLLLSPGTPMLFQGQEFSASSPFLYFANFEGDLADAVRRGRHEFLTQFPSIAEYQRANVLDDPADSLTFERSKLDLHERVTHAEAYALHKDLMRLRRDDAAFRAQQPGGVDGAVLAPQAFALRFFTPEHAEDRVLLVNLGADLKRSSFPEPLLAPPEGCDWTVHWSSEDSRYGGGGMRKLWPGGWWSIPGESAIVLAAGPCERAKRREQHDG